MSVDDRIVELLSEWGARRAQGHEASAEQLCHDCPDLIETLRGVLRQRPSPLEGSGPPTGPTRGATGGAGHGGLTDGFVENLEPMPDAGELGCLGPYRVAQLLGAGGMGAVFRAIDETLHRQVALKVLRPSLAHDPLARERFLREARAAAALEHDHIVTIFQVGEERGIPFLAMPLLTGTSLQSRLDRDEALSIPEVLRIGREIAEGL